MPRRQQVRMACLRCRRRRAKCSGDNPCERCKEARQHCTFDRSGRESKDDLRAEIERLRQINKQKDALLDALSSKVDIGTYRAVTDGVNDGTEAHQDNLGELAEIKAGVAHQRARTRSERRPSVVVSAAKSAGAMPTAVCPHCRGAPFTMQSQSQSQSQLLSSRTTRDEGSPTRNSERNLFAKACDIEDFATQSLMPLSIPSWILSVSPPTGEEGLSLPLVDKWTRTGWAEAGVRKLLESLLTWDYLPFCLVCKEPFLHDYTTGNSRYCSSALVNALLALAIRTVNLDEHQRQQQDGRENFASMPNSPDDLALFEEAEALVKGGAHSLTLPDIQALGILSIYHLSCGHEADAAVQAEVFAASMTTLCLQESPMGTQEKQYARVLAMAYCGSISLKRILKLTAIRHAGQYANVLQDDGIVLDQSCGSGTPCLVECNTHEIPDAHISQLYNLQLIPAKIFQLTEWVYKMVASSRMRDPATYVGASQVMAVYTRCLDWYQSLFALLKKGSSNSPFGLFIQ
ncbi:hypothetical protein JDV02_001880 [Purpureocillium takamizusanense]|uniref:Zn(2)-C6 fungal-type domain-containing protein n=1 Tax=Purpureocillium takamizusanense TaxID=2060973 RepID=A0A9Q8Q988_9HYPO|nr:uncharacterized protein JDV02_001880 [Purpureocillium takamizusanense]UNI15340.1 hypothetical protein JDV02_001880 [Purpureocillium takamizusanense]